MTDEMSSSEKIVAGWEDQADKYLRAVHGDSYGYRAPESFGLFDRWMWAVASSNPGYGAKVMDRIRESLSVVYEPDHSEYRAAHEDNWAGMG